MLMINGEIQRLINLVEIANFLTAPLFYRKFQDVLLALNS